MFLCLCLLHSTVKNTYRLKTAINCPDENRKQAALLCLLGNHRHDGKTGLLCCCTILLLLVQSVQSLGEQQSIASREVDAEEEKEKAGNVGESKLDDEDQVPEGGDGADHPEDAQQGDALEDGAVQAERRRDDGHQRGHEDGAQIDQRR